MYTPYRRDFCNDKLTGLFDDITDWAQENATRYVEVCHVFLTDDGWEAVVLYQHYDYEEEGEGNV